VIATVVSSSPTWGVARNFCQQVRSSYQHRMPTPVRAWIQ
jgi:hypothetical protein